MIVVVGGVAATGWCMRHQPRVSPITTRAAIRAGTSMDLGEPAGVGVTGAGVGAGSGEPPWLTTGSGVVGMLPPGLARWNRDTECVTIPKDLRG